MLDWTLDLLLGIQLDSDLVPQSMWARLLEEMKGKHLDYSMDLMLGRVLYPMSDSC